MFLYLLLLNFINPSTLFELSQEEVFHKAEHIISAYVISIDCELEHTDSGQIPYSHINLKINKVHYTSQVDSLYLDQEIQIRQVGCSDEEVSFLEIDGLSKFKADTNVFLSLNRIKNTDYSNYFYVTANEQGKLDYDSDDTLIKLDHHSTSYVRKGASGKIKFIKRKSPKIYKLNDLVNKISKIKGDIY